MRHVTTVIAAVIATVAISFAVAQAGPSQGSATDRAAVRELRKLNTNVRSLQGRLDNIDKHVGNQGFGSVKSVLKTICRQNAQPGNFTSCDL